MRQSGLQGQVRAAARAEPATAHATRVSHATFKNGRVTGVHGRSEEAEVLRFIIGGTLEELGCGHNPKAPRFDIYPAGPNSPGALHFGVNGLKESEYLRRVMPIGRSRTSTCTWSPSTPR